MSNANKIKDWLSNGDAAFANYIWENCDLTMFNVTYQSFAERLQYSILHIMKGRKPL